MRSLWLQVFSMNLRKLLTYRASFWVNFFMNIFGYLGIAYFLWRSVYSFEGKQVIGGYTFSAMMFYYLLAALVDKIVQGTEVMILSNDIYEGGLNRYLIYPLSVFTFKFTESFAYSVTALIQAGLALLVFFFLFSWPEGVQREPWQFFSGLSLCLLSAILYFILSALLDCVAFWADNVWSLTALKRISIYFLGGGAIPLDLFPKWAENFLRLTPFPHFLSSPILAFMGKLTWQDFLQNMSVMLGWIGVLSLTLLMVWRKGLKQYAGVGI